MVAPYAHIARFDERRPDQMTEMMELAQRGMRALKTLYRPEGFNIGMNLGHAPVPAFASISTFMSCRDGSGTRIS